MEIQIEDIFHLSIESDLSVEMNEDLKANMLDGKVSRTCKQCGFSTAKASYLKSHLLGHSGEKPFSCKQCK